MPEHHWSVLCRDGIVDQPTNRLSLLNVVEQIVIAFSAEDIEAGKRSEPLVILSRLKIISFWSRTVREVTEQFEMRVGLIAPDGKIAYSTVTPKMTLDGSISTRTFMALDGIQYRGAGPYRIVVEWRATEDSPWTRAATLPLEITIAPKKEPKTEEAQQPEVKARVIRPLIEP